MTETTAAEHDQDTVALSERGPASKDLVVRFGFWLFLLSDIVIFAALFAAYSVLSQSTAGGPSGAALFSRTHTFIETTCLLLSSFTCGLMTVGVEIRSRMMIYLSGMGTFVLGTAFVVLEVMEFMDIVAKGAGRTHSAFLSAFFTLVSTHGLHVTAGLLWLVVMMAQVATLGLRPMVIRRLFCFSLFWHALDIVWVGVFIIVYLGAR
ncbi:cytochrome c oxidase subunit 3 [Rhizobium sp. 2YAF20]|uniref:cytochrome c oxidase subunit 3 n=1 Tax=Rhizobium sp. 2YAF20 TaxID=3233027 RepID=UPI003F950D62